MPFFKIISTTLYILFNEVQLSDTCWRGRGVLPLCWGAVSVFCSPSQLGKVFFEFVLSTMLVTLISINVLQKIRTFCPKHLYENCVFKKQVIVLLLVRKCRNIWYLKKWDSYQFLPVLSKIDDDNDSCCTASSNIAKCCLHELNQVWHMAMKFSFEIPFVLGYYESKCLVIKKNAWNRYLYFVYEILYLDIST